MPHYHPQVIEPLWQKFWEENKTFRTPDLPTRPKYYILDMFPYPSGDGLHVGHPEGYTATDILARYKRMKGFDVLHPMGWDAFGLPAEQYAIQTGTHPKVTTQKNIATFRRQIKSLGFSYDWDREVDTTDLNYVKWTQWIFLVLYNSWFDPCSQKARSIDDLPLPEDVKAKGEKAVAEYRDRHRLVYVSNAPVNWCPELGTVLAHEEVIDGKSERGNHPVVRMPLKQWMMRITAYAQRLLEDLDGLQWSDALKEMQRNWIGRSEGAEIDFAVADHPDKTIRVFTTRPDTLFGATYMVLAPEHALVKEITSTDQKAFVQDYQELSSRKSELERIELAKKKNGVFTGGYAINPGSGERIPIWIADYVVASYGTGAIMAVPAHDERDFEFATQYQLPIKQVVQRATGFNPVVEAAMTEDGTAMNSGILDGKSTADAKSAIISWLEEKKIGVKRINYKIRDWLFSRQRYWGEPFPLLHRLDSHGEPDGTIRALSPTDLPVPLPEMADYKPSGKPEPPLGKAADWHTIEIEGVKYRRELNTMPQWAGSCWYYLRYIDPKNDTLFVSPEKERAWMPVDLYVGGAEHAVLHLLYARFWHKVLFDRGHVSSPEPFARLVNQGMILGEARYFTPEEKVVPDEEVELKAGKAYWKKDGKTELEPRAEKMSKSRGNVINPDLIVREYGADSMRLYEMFMGPLEATKPWSTRGVEGVSRFLARVWRLIIDDKSEHLALTSAVQEIQPDAETLTKLHQTIKKVTEDLDNLRFNTAIACMMEFTNHLTRYEARPRSVLNTFILLLAPFAPHMCEELWSVMGHAQSLAYEPWPQFDLKLATPNSIEIPVQVNGKLRSKVTVPADANEATIKQAALDDDRIKELIGGKEIRKTIIVPKKLVNLVVA